MDLYLTSAEPGLTLQEMIEYDIRSGAFENCIPEEAPSKITKMEFDPNPFDLELVDIATMTTLDDDFEFKPFEPVFEPLLPELEIESKCSSIDSPLPIDTLGSWMNFSSVNSCNVDILDHGTIMVNPSVVLPSTMHGGTGLTTGRNTGTYLSVSAPSSSPVIDTSTNSIKNRSNYSVSNSISAVTTSSNSTNALYSIKKEPLSVIASNRLVPTISSSLTHNLKQQQAVSTQVILNPINTSTLANPSTVLTNAFSLKSSNLLTTLATNKISNTPILALSNATSTPNSTSIITNNSNKTLQTGIIPAASIVTTAINRIGTSPIYRTTSNGNHQSGRAKTIPKYKRDRTPEERVYPKPAYSYSCLIALALKNSLTGSLPVSEIYSFMCEHFPYFRTAPNGWKNSVRHNLSLNKCFEKIEKPVASGSNQRKGCLWTLNPTKAHKMDEEVQKWSKKDLQGIKDAMPNPGILENLERGEMKFEVTSSGASSCSEDEEEEEIDLVSTENLTSSDIQPIKILNPLNTRIIQPSGNGVLRTLNQMKLASLQGAKANLASRLVSSDSQATTLHVRRNSSSALHSPTMTTSQQEPDSTMSEINIQSNGAIVDDFGNEIKIEGELGVLNPSSSSNLILRKINSPLRHSPVKSNFIYAASPHQSAINRLVLTNTKLSS